jgi:hypothetical protein
MRRKRLLLYVALALAVPVPALAVGLASSGGGSLDTQASLDSCGLLDQQIICKIDVAYNTVDGADSYTASVTAPTGAVSDFGDVGAGGTSVWVPYVGDGTYTVQVQAWGTPPSPNEKAPLIASDKASAGGQNATDVAGPAAPDEATGLTGATGVRGATGTTGAAGTTDTRATTDVTGTTGDTGTTDVVVPPPPPPAPCPPPDPSTGATGTTDTTAQGNVPDTTTLPPCTDPAQTGCCTPTG